MISSYFRICGLLSLWIISTSCNETIPSSSVGLFTPTSPLVTFRVSFHTGSIDDPKDKSGLNALTALTVARGGTSTLTYQELTETLYPWAASIDVRFDKELTTIIGQVHRDHLEPFYEILLDLVVEPRFDQQDFERNKDFLLNSISSTLKGNDDESLGKQALNGFLYENHPYGTTEMGSVTGLNAITVEDVKTFHKARYTRNNLLIGLAGGYPETFLERAEKHLLNSLPQGNSKRPPLPQPRKLDSVEVILVQKPSIATAISIGYPIDVTRRDEDFYPLLIANSYLGEHRTFNGRLMNNMRGLRGLNYGDYSYIENFIQDGISRFPVPNIPRTQQFFSIWIRPVPHRNAHFALRQALRELQMLVDDGLSKKDFETTRNFLINYTKLLIQTSSRRLGYAMDSRFYGTSFFVDKVTAALRTLKVDDVNTAIKKHLQYKNIAVAIVTPHAELLKAALLSNELSPITYSTEVNQEIIDEDKDISTFYLTINPNRIRVVPIKEMFR